MTAGDLTWVTMCASASFQVNGTEFWNTGTLCRAPGRQDASEGICMRSLQLLEAGREALPFVLTNGQTQALREVLTDLRGPAPMMRMLQARYLPRLLLQTSPEKRSCSI